MREIKFRAWEKKSVVMRLWDYLRGINYTRQFTLFDDPDFVWMQYTGLKDKNGKEIYESDIVRGIDKHDEEFILEVKWISHLSGWYYVDKTCKEGEWISHLGMFDNGEEVIGNIYENPELK